MWPWLINLGVPLAMALIALGCGGVASEVPAWSHVASRPKLQRSPTPRPRVSPTPSPHVRPM